MYKKCRHCGKIHSHKVYICECGSMDLVPYEYNQKEVTPAKPAQPVKDQTPPSDEKKGKKNKKKEEEKTEEKTENESEGKDD